MTACIAFYWIKCNNQPLSLSITHAFEGFTLSPGTLFCYHQCRFSQPHCAL